MMGEEELWVNINTPHKTGIFPKGQILGSSR